MKNHGKTPGKILIIFFFCYFFFHSKEGKNNKNNNIKKVERKFIGGAKFVVDH